MLAYTNAMDFEAFTRDQRTIDAVVRNLEVIGEASLHVPGEIQERHPAIPWREMRAMRNLLSHGYFVTDVAVVWRTAHEDLPALVHHLREILDIEEEL